MDELVAIINYGMGNVQSVANAINAIGYKAIITRDKTEIESATHLILPGVGAFPTAMENLKKLGLIEILNEEVIEKKKPFLGICLGMQLIGKTGYENGVTPGLGWVDADVIKFDFKDSKLKIPHVGWNDVVCDTEKKLFLNSQKIQTFYFVHSYYLNCKKDIMVGECEYGIKFAAVIEQNNIFAAQFHPEKSQQDGLDLLKKFIDVKR